MPQVGAAVNNPAGPVTVQLVSATLNPDPIIVTNVPGFAVKGNRLIDWAYANGARVEITTAPAAISNSATKTDFMLRLLVNSYPLAPTVWGPFVPNVGLRLMPTI